MSTLPERLRRWVRPTRPLPPVAVVLGPWTPGWTLRAVHAVTVGALVLLSAAPTGVMTGLVVSLVVALAAWTLARPGAGPGHVAVILAALMLLGAGGGPFDPSVLWLAPLGFVVTRLGWWASLVAPRERVELAALRRAAARDLVVVVVTVLVGLVAWTVAGRPVAGLVALGVAALAALAWISVAHHDGTETEAP